MKNYVFISLSITILILVVFSILAFEQKIDPKITAFNKSLDYENSFDYEKAVKELINIYNENKDNYLINLRLGWLYYNLGLNNESRIYYENAVKILPNSIEAKIGLTLPLSKLENWDEVRKLYEQILKLDPQNYTANLRLGQYYLLRGNYYDANKYLSISIKNFPSDYESNLSFGWTQYYIGNKKKAKELFINTLMLSPNDSLATIGYNLSR
jgi:tetratricopeptide (TPR) repeat protein